MTKFPWEIENCDLADGRILEELEQICFPGAAWVTSGSRSPPQLSQKDLYLSLFYILRLGTNFICESSIFEKKNVYKGPSCIIFILSINSYMKF